MTFDQAHIKLRYIAERAMRKQRSNEFGYAYFWAIFRPEGKVRWTKRIILMTDGRENLGQIAEDIRSEVNESGSGIELRSLYFNLD